MLADAPTGFTNDPADFGGDDGNWRENPSDHFMSRGAEVMTIWRQYWLAIRPLRSEPAAPPFRCFGDGRGSDREGGSRYYQACAMSARKMMRMKP